MLDFIEWKIDFRLRSDFRDGIHFANESLNRVLKKDVDFVRAFTSYQTRVKDLLSRLLEMAGMVAHVVPGAKAGAGAPVPTGQAATERPATENPVDGDGKANAPEAGTGGGSGIHDPTGRTIPTSILEINLPR